MGALVGSGARRNRDHPSCNPSVNQENIVAEKAGNELEAHER
jgi:hypothetical protein